MTDSSRRRRKRNGVAVTREADFYCLFGRHYVIALDFEKDADNKGVCMDCAFEINHMLTKISRLTPMSKAREMKARKSWEALESDMDRIERIRGDSRAPGWIYYVRQADLIKIGYAKDVTKRIKAYGPTAQLLAVHPGTMELEKQIHRKFVDSLDSGREWFRPDADLMEHIQDALTRFGDPAVFEYQYTKPKSQEEKVRAMFATRGIVPVADGAHYAGR